jgi:hypothetical protein
MQELRRKLKRHPWLKMFVGGAILGGVAAFFGSKPPSHLKRDK